MGWNVLMNHNSDLTYSLWVPSYNAIGSTCLSVSTDSLSVTSCSLHLAAHCTWPSNRDSTIFHSMFDNSFLNCYAWPIKLWVLPYEMKAKLPHISKLLCCTPLLLVSSNGQPHWLYSIHLGNWQIGDTHITWKLQDKEQIAAFTKSSEMHQSALQHTHLLDQQAQCTQIW